ncbi:MAG: triphosphoribosyl-dephospho-CoA synthase [Candidatus Bathyarchaeia archaeon]
MRRPVKESLEEAEETAEDLMVAAQLSAALEVSGWPKPGNVHRTADHPDTRFEHFLAGATAMGPTLRRTTLLGMKAGFGMIEVSEVEVGRLVRQAVSSVKQWHRGGNTHLGVCLMFVPLVAAAGKTYAEHGKTPPSDIAKNVDIVMRSTTPEDAAEVYKAILTVSTVQELGEVKGEQAPDLYDPKAKKRLLEEGISLFDVMETASGWDTIAGELTAGMRVSFKVGYPMLIDTFHQTQDINTATVHTFLTLLSKFPDTFIARKIGLKETSDIKKAVSIGRRKTGWISERAGHILELGGLTSEAGRVALSEFDRTLQSAQGELNPGTTADLTAASLLIAILDGLRF